MEKCAVLLLVALSLLTALAWASPHHSHRVTVIDREAESDNCQDHLQLGYDGAPAVYAEETRAFPNQPLEVVASPNGGIHVTDWDRPEFSIKLCKAAAGEDAERVLGSITLAVSGGRVTITGPAGNLGDRWSTDILIKAPAGAKLDLRVENGGISLYKTSATTTAHAVNGGIDLKMVHASVQANAVNGGISIEDSSGNVTARVQNGGLDLKLGTSWQGGNLVASSENGGLSVELPRNFASTLEVSTAQYTGISCDAEACHNAQRTWDDDRRYLRLGSGTPVIKVSTENGGVEIHDVRSQEGRI